MAPSVVGDVEREGVVVMDPAPDSGPVVEARLSLSAAIRVAALPS